MSFGCSSGSLGNYYRRHLGRNDKKAWIRKFRLCWRIKQIIPNIDFKVCYNCTNSIFTLYVVWVSYCISILPVNIKEETQDFWAVLVRHGFHGVHIFQMWQASTKNTFSLTGKQQQHLNHRIHRACPQVSNTCKYPKRFVCTGLALCHCFACVHACFGHSRCHLKTCMCMTIRRWLWRKWIELSYVAQ